MGTLNYFTLRKPQWVEGLKTALSEAYWGNGLERTPLQVGLLEDSSDTESVLGTDYGEAGGGEEAGEGQKVPSLMELCSRVLAESPEMLTEMKSRSNLSLRDIWKSVKAKRDRDAEELRTKYTVSVKGSRDEKVALMRILSRKIWDSDKVVSLVLDDCRDVDDGLLLGLCLKGKKLTLPYLEHISLNSCTSVSDASLIPIIRAYSKQLKSVHISRSGVTHKSIKAIAKWCPELQVADFSHLLTIQDRHLTELAINCKNLRDVNLSYCKLITDIGIGSLASSLWHLEALNVSYCSKVGKSILQLRDCKFLQRLRLQDCPLITNSILVPVVECCSLLEVLCIRSCQAITMSTIKKIADCSTNMRMLDVVGTNVNGNKALGVLGQSTHVKNTLQEYLSTNRVVLRLTPHIWNLYAAALEANI